VTEHPNLPAAWWAENLEELDREIARLATLCHVRILDLGVIEQVLRKDASVCGTDNPAAFEKLHNLLMMYFAIRERTVDSIGQAQTVAIENYIIERLKKSFPGLGQWPPP
jgi:sigma54-dependent transcription regulator